LKTVAALSLPLRREQRIDNQRRLIEIHEIAYGDTTDGLAPRLPAILERDRESLAELIASNPEPSK
jgi:hypothetical protein